MSEKAFIFLSLNLFFSEYCLSLMSIAVTCLNLMRKHLLLSHRLSKCKLYTVLGCRAEDPKCTRENHEMDLNRCDNECKYIRVSMMNKVYKPPAKD